MTLLNVVVYVNGCDVMGCDVMGLNIMGLVTMELDVIKTNPCMVINVSVQYNGGLLLDIILTTQCYYHT